MRRAQEPSPLPLPTSAEGKVPPPSPHPQPGSPPSPEIFLPGTLPNRSTASSDKSIQRLDDVFSNFVSSKVSTKKNHKKTPKKQIEPRVGIVQGFYEWKSALITSDIILFFNS